MDLPKIKSRSINVSMLESFYSFCTWKFIFCINMGVNFLSEYINNIIYGVKTLLTGMGLTLKHLRNKKE